MHQGDEGHIDVGKDSLASGSTIAQFSDVRRLRAGQTVRPVAVEVSGAAMAFGDGATRHTVFEDISFEVGSGEIFCIVGASGCGKTTLLRQIAGLQRPTSGSIRFEGVPIERPSRERAIVFQDYGRALLPWRTVRANIELGLDSKGMAQGDIAATVERLMDITGLAAAASKYPSELSGGMQQRVQIARCMAQKPRLLLMDEPFGALDALTRQSLQDELMNLAARENITVIFITHDLEEAIYLGDRVLALGSNPGRILTTIDIGLDRPRHQLRTREAAEFLEKRHLLHGLIVGH
jgi:NitT/TauT family transport system ATP-binding protein